MNKMGKGPWVSTTKRTLLVKLQNFNDKSVAIQIRVPDLKNRPNMMTNFNQLVIQEFEFLKLYVCFDLPLSTLNRSQAENINDLENFLVARSLYSTDKKESLS